jgi:hypothetical protein
MTQPLDIDYLRKTGEIQPKFAISKSRHERCHFEQEWLYCACV